MKRFPILLLLVLFFITGCSADEKGQVKFKQEKVKIELTQQYKNDYFIGYAINVTNNSSVTISHLNMYVNLPIRTKDGTKENSFVLVGVPNKEDTKLKNGEKLEFTFEGFLEVLNQEKLDLKNPVVKLTGSVEEEQFEITKKLKTKKK
ncbi:hypothetical protein SAMN05880501_106176 [Ureibacillus xyleni]|uniref:DUF4352 domain-containing protein n=1 Tax=Ureibacillus xyleni TaxID=614648 RepID=A0A285ST18_9BACL|nr:hypothetical protein [Ureibacillus xyleni]SOC11498.1 hypothetical protein SAMN05880501_106176 [Ureibacillus xyleni]